MENEILEPIENISFGKEITKAFAISLASTAGMVAGLIIIGFVVKKVKDHQKTSGKNLRIVS